MDLRMPAKYVLYSHYAYGEGDDFESWRKGVPCSELTGMRYLVRHLAGLSQLLASPAYEGLLVLFYAPGFSFATCLQGIADGFSREKLLSSHEELAYANDIANYVDSILPQYGELYSRLRFVTPLDLYDIIGRINWTIADNLKWWFIGTTDKIRYDTPKIVEAIVRLRILGTGVPVFRLDYDVLFRGKENEDAPDLGMFKAIASCLRAFQLRRDEASIATFLLSASYDTRDVLSPSSRGDFASWVGAFATRVFPALPIDKRRIEAVQASGSQEPYGWDEYAHDVFDETMARRFFGIRASGLKNQGVSGIGKIGANPIVSVISGAMFCLSDGAILDLPPFSNFGINVSWIDDHLKYSLHRELRHLTTVELKIEPLLSDAKLDTVMVRKARSRIGNLPGYVLGMYLPTLLWGTVMDAWITSDALLKFRPEHLARSDKERWEGLPRKGRSQAILSGALQGALEKEHLGKGERERLRENLTVRALERINEVRDQWAGLADAGCETFASIWAKGITRSYFENLEPRCHGIAEPDVPVGKPISKPVELNRYLGDDFRQLLSDAIEYIEWTLHWPQIVQVVRSVEQGTVRTDMSWPGLSTPMKVAD